MEDHVKTSMVSHLTGFFEIDSSAFNKTEIDDLDLSSLIQSYQKLGSCFFLVTDFAKMKYLYVSPSTFSITGYPVDNWLNGGLSFCSSVYHPDELAFQKMIHLEILRFQNSLPVSEKLKYRYCFNLRLRRSDGKYVRLLCQMITLKTDTKGYPKYILELFTDIDIFDKNGINTLTISRYDEKTGYSEIVDYFVPEEITKGLSKRESEINHLAISGLTSGEIAKKLGLSKNTVDTYRKKIKRKLAKSKRSPDDEKKS